MRSSALAGALSLALGSAALAADAKVVAFDLPSQALGESLRDFAPRANRSSSPKASSPAAAVRR